MYSYREDQVSLHRALFSSFCIPSSPAPAIITLLRSPLVHRRAAPSAARPASRVTRICKFAAPPLTDSAGLSCRVSEGRGLGPSPPPSVPHHLTERAFRLSTLAVTEECASPRAEGLLDQRTYGFSVFPLQMKCFSYRRTVFLCCVCALHL